MTPTFLNPPHHNTIPEFAAYVAGLKFDAWKPKMPYLHNTGVPSLRQWFAMGATPQERWGSNLNNYYKSMGWHSGPHLVCCPDYVWVLADPTKPGVAESCSNAVAFAVEMVGNFEIGGDDFSTGSGAKVRDNAAAVLAIIADKVGWGDLADYEFNQKGLHFHHDCKQDHHACPGSKVSKPDMLARISALRGKHVVTPTFVAEPNPLKEPLSPDFMPTPAIWSVDDVQAALVKLGFLPHDGVDGLYGNGTRTAVEMFQRGFPLSPVDGWVGPDTEKALISALATLAGKDKAS